MQPLSLTVDHQVLLKSPNIEDAEEVYQLIDSQRDHLGEWLAWVHRTTSVRHTLDFIQTSIKFNAGGQKLTFFIKKDNQIIGSLGFVRIDIQNKKAEIGYWLDQNHTGKGIVSKSCRQLIHFGFQTLNLNKLIIKAIQENTASLAIPERLGFSRDGIMREEVWMHDRFYNKVVFSLLKKEWDKKL